MALQMASSPSFANPNESKLFEPNHSPPSSLATIIPNILPAISKNILCRTVPTTNANKYANDDGIFEWPNEPE